MKWRLAAGLAMAAGLAVSACSTASAPARPAHPASRSASGHRAPATAAAGLAAQPAATGAPARLPGCTTAATPARNLRATRAMIRVGGDPFGVAVTPDGRYVFVSRATSGVQVYRVGRELALTWVRSVTVPGTLLGEALTSGGRYLLVASNRGAVVIDVAAGCQPVRVITSADGAVAWVTARGSNTLLGFSTALLRSHPARSLIARVGVGEAPVGLALVDHGRQIVVADSNRFDTPGASASLAVVRVADALADRPALAGLLPAGVFPREMTVAPSGRTLLVTCFGSGQLELVSLTGPL